MLDFIGWVAIVLAAIAPAANQASKDIEVLRQHFPGGILSGRWNYIPLILLVVGLAILWISHSASRSSSSGAGYQAPAATSSRPDIRKNPVVPLPVTAAPPPHIVQASPVLAGRQGTKSVEPPPSTQAIADDKPSSCKSVGISMTDTSGWNIQNSKFSGDCGIISKRSTDIDVRDSQFGQPLAPQTTGAPSPIPASPAQATPQP